jgi:hypothetical protein
VAVGDFNGDGVLDLAVVNGGDSSGRGRGVSVLLGHGDGTFGPAVTYAAGNFPQAVAVGDFNGDGVPDLAVANYGSDTVSVLLGQGDGTFRPATNYFVGFDPISVAVGDFNGDGILDLAVANQGSSPDYADGNVSVLLGQGDGTFRSARNYTAGIGPSSVVVGDFNGDGIPDLAVADAGGGASVLLGNGDGTFGAALSYTAGRGPISVAVADFNGDGFPDLAVANNLSDDVSILLNDGNWSPSPGGAPGREAGRAINRPSSAALLLPAPSLTLSANGLPGEAAANPVMAEQPLIPSVAVDSLFAAPPPDESAAPVAGFPLAGHEMLRAGRWHPRIHDLDLPEEALATLAWDQW